MAKETTDEDPENRPLLVYDGDCGFCKRSVERLKLSTGDAVQYVPFQDRENRPSTVSEEEYSEAVYLFLPDRNEPIRGAEAVYKTLMIGNRPALNFLYEKVPLFARVSEAAYRLVA
ncbi:MAG: DCC1-like thiol-disulfide oxidoreductase family protein, partial [Opitutales bacterium]